MKRRTFVQLGASVRMLVPTVIGAVEGKFGIEPSYSNEASEHDQSDHYDLSSEAYDFAIDQLIKSFDFKCVESAMIFSNWSWSINGEMVIPSIDDMKLEIRRRFKAMELDNTPATRFHDGFLMAKYDFGVFMKFILDEDVYYYHELPEYLT